MPTGLLGLLVLPFTLAQTPEPGPREVDARGEKEVVFKAPASGMYRVRVTGDAGTACSLADHLRGPFTSSGKVGRENCDVDVMLDAGLYKARLNSPEKGKGRAKLDATPFAEAGPAVKLDAGKTIEARLRVHQQIAGWLQVEKRKSVTVEVAGRTAGLVTLWRDGRWLEDINFEHQARSPNPGKEIHRWRMDAVLEPGVYKLVVFGTQPKVWTKGPEEDVVFITHGAPPGGAARSQAFTIPSWGFVQLAVEPSAVASFVQLDAPPAGAVELTAEQVNLDSTLGLMRTRSVQRCSVAAGQPNPSCVVTSSIGREGAHVLQLEGPPGTRGEVWWGPLGDSDTEGYWPAGSTRDLTIGADGTYFVTAPALPMSMDAEPLACAIDEVNDKGRFVRRVAVDAPAVSWTQPFERRFNFDARSTAVWVQIARAGLYEVKSNDALSSSCEVFRLDADARERMGEGGPCNTTRALSAGLYEVRFYGGRPGIQTLRVAQVGLGGKAATPAKSSCTFENLPLVKGRYRLQTSSDGGAQLRAFFARGTPSSANVALPLAVDPDRPVRVPLAAGAAVLARTRPGRVLKCALNDVELPTSGGVCQTGPLTQASTLTLRTDEALPLMAVVQRVEPAAASTVAARFDPEVVKLPTLTADTPLWFNFERDQSRSMQVVVDKPGLYDVATEGLLATSCRLRTPTIGTLVDGAQNGRGRNCQVQAYLKQGTYLFTATAQASSRGRAGVRLVHRPARDLGLLGMGDEVFFRVGAGELVQHTMDVRKGGAVGMGTTAQGATLSCRFDDHDGWPLTTVPTSCTRAETLDSGRYILTTLPLSVDSRRRASLIRPRDEVTLEGDKTHALALNRSYQAQLGRDGKDAFTFTVTADMDVGIELDRGMQGRVLRVVNGTKEAIDTVPPVGGGGLSLGGSEGESGESGESGEYGEDGEYVEDSGEYSEGEYSEGEYGEYGDSGESGDDEYATRMRERQEELRRAAAAAEMAKATAPREMEGLKGHTIQLKAGTYILETEHSRGDVAIGYRVAVNARALAPNVVLMAPVPGRVDVVMPPTADARSGLLRIKTRGDSDVRCRLRDNRGVLVAESADSGADWNCALAVPLGPGTYSLYLEAETLQPGVTELSAAFLEAKDTGELKDGDTFRVVAKVAAAPLPAAGPDVVQDVRMTSDQDFSCAVQDDKGAVLERQVSVRSCRFLLWPGAEKRRFHVFAWTPDRAATVKVGFATREVKGFGGGSLDDDEAGRVRIDVRGRYTTGAGALCRVAASGGGPLTSCEGAESFPAGEVLVAVPSGGRVEMKESTALLSSRTDEARLLKGARAPQRQRSRGRALHLVEVQVPFGSRAAPSCSVEGGVAAHEAATCFAATGPVEESTLTTWTATDSAVSASLVRRAVAWPDSKGVLPAGVTTLSWGGESARWSLPVEGFRIKLALPSDAWAVLVDDAGRARDLCAPRRAPTSEQKGAMTTCVLRGKGGEVVLASSASPDASRDARADLLVLSTAEAPRALVGMRETKPAMPGRERLLVAADPAVREVRVEGRGVLACAIHLDNGGHVAGCRATLPAGQGGEIRVEHDDRPWRVFTHKPGEVMAARYGALPSGMASNVALGTATALTGQVVQRRLEVKQPSAVRVRATSGVCAVSTGGVIVESQGLGAGCDIVRVLPAGSHVLTVRAFGTAPLSGNVNVSAEPVTVLDEGPGPEAIVAAGDARTFRFTLAGDGEVGVGLQANADALGCLLLDDKQELVGDGCHQFHRLKRGTYYLRVESPDDGPPRRFKPVVFGLKGSVVDVPEAWLRDFFARIPNPSASSKEESR